MPGQAITLTATRRLATYLVDQTIKAHKDAVVEKPPIYAWHDALMMMYQTLMAQGMVNVRLLQASESLLLFEDIIQASPYAEGLLKLNTTAKLAWQAWQNFTLWACEDTEETAHQPDYRAFYEWIQSYQAKLAKNGWIDSAQLPGLIIKHWTKSLRVLPWGEADTLEFVGFDDLPPMHQALVAHLETIGWTVKQQEPLAEQPASLSRHVFPSVEQELQSAILWAKTHLENPDHQIAIIVPELPKHRLKLAHYLRQTFHPMAIFTPAPVVSEYYNMSAGQPLNTLPIIVKAMNLLNAWQPTGRQSHADWTQAINQQLLAASWPGELPLDSVEHQATAQWQQMLRHFQKLDRLFPPADFTQARLRLKHILQDIPFQPQSHVVRLHVLGTLEAAGQQFTHLWLCGLTDHDWPSPPNPNPFIPLRLQKEKMMPHATHERQLRFVENMMTRLMAAAPHIVLSHATTEGNQHRQPSALIREYPVTRFPHIQQAPTVFEKLHQSAKTITIKDTKGPKLSFEIIPGGATTLQAQAQCPFKAFAQVRLTLPQPDTPCQGLNLAERGMLVHQILEAIWHKIKTSRHLQSLSAQALETLIDQQVTKALETHGHAMLKMKGQYWQAEHRRLTKLMHKWLALEKTRDDFEVVASECLYPIKLLGKNLNVRIDRIDKNDAGNYFIIDYKTGKADRAGLLTEPLLSPQLAIYCFNQQFPTPDALIYGQVKSDHCQFVGFSQVEGAFPGVKMGVDDWDAQMAKWQQQIEQLIADFINGEAAVKPSHHKICEYCHIKSLCRIQGASE